MGGSESLEIRRAFEEYLDEQEDYMIALRRLEENLPPIAWEAALNELSLRNKFPSEGPR